LKDWTAIRERYLRDAVPIRLGGLAANMSRIKSFSANDASQAVVEGLIEESKLFIEWTAVESGIETAAELVELQLLLARWHRNWPTIWPDPAQRKEVAEQSGEWSKRVLGLSGLI
jgi:hypothetical protein